MTLHIPEFHTAPYNEITRKAINLDDFSGRQKMIRNLLYPYNRFLDIKDKITEWHKPVGDLGDPEIGDLGLLLGDTGNGKSYMLKSFYKDALKEPEGNRMRFPVIYIQVLSTYKGGSFAKALLKATGKKLGSKRQNVDELGECAIERMQEYETVLIIIDDAHLLFTQKRYYEDHFGLLKGIVDAQFANLLLAGLPHLTKAVIGDRQIGRRCGFKVDVPVFDAAKEAMHYQAFLNGVDERLPFSKESGLAEPRNVERLFLASEGSVGITMAIIKRAARLALTARSACIMDHHIRSAIEDVALADKEALLMDEEAA